MGQKCTVYTDKTLTTVAYDGELVGITLKRGHLCRMNILTPAVLVAREDGTIDHVCFKRIRLDDEDEGNGDS